MTDERDYYNCPDAMFIGDKVRYKHAIESQGKLVHRYPVHLDRVSDKDFMVVQYPTGYQVFREEDLVLVSCGTPKPPDAEASELDITPSPAFMRLAVEALREQVKKSQDLVYRASNFQAFIAGGDISESQISYDNQQVIAEGLKLLIDQEEARIQSIEDGLKSFEVQS